MYDNEKQKSKISYEHKKFAKCGNSLQQQQTNHCNKCKR